LTAGAKWGPTLNWPNLCTWLRWYGMVISDCCSQYDPTGFEVWCWSPGNSLEFHSPCLDETVELACYRCSLKTVSQYWGENSVNLLLVVEVERISNTIVSSGSFICPYTVGFKLTKCDAFLGKRKNTPDPHTSTSRTELSNWQLSMGRNTWKLEKVKQGSLRNFPLALSHAFEFYFDFSLIAPVACGMFQNL
jgi:hypothetical protein